jgi:putative MATE family efflux protein
LYLCTLKIIGMTGQKTPTALGTEKIGKLLMQYAIPVIIAMTASSLYNMVDSIFIGHGVGPMAISGLALTFPLMNLAAAFGSLVGVGAATLVSVKLGQKDYDTAQRVLGNVLVLNIIIGLAFTILTLIFLDPILYFFGGSDETVGYARDYMKVILYGNVITHLYLGLNAVLRSAGHPQKAMYATIATVVINTILDPLFIYGFGWGIQGAAIATILAQVISLMWQFRLFSNKEELLHFHRGIFRLKRKIVFDSLAIGMAPFLMNLASCFIVILINQGLKKYGGDLAIGAFGIVNRLVFLFVMIVMGLNQGMQPIAGYNFGARLYPRVTRVLKLTIYGATIVTTTGFLMGMLIPGLAVSIFTSHEELIRQSAEGLRIVVLFFPIVGFQMVTSNFFQSIGMASKAIFLSITRQVLILIPCLLILPRYFGQTGVWVSMPVSDLIASLISAGMLWWQFRLFRIHGRQAA